MDTSIGAVLFGLLSAACWGAGDFSGGIATKRLNVYPVVITSQIAGTAVLILLALVFQHSVPPLSDWLIGALAGAIGSGVGIVLLYSALASGKMGVAAPLSGVVAASIPVIFGTLLQGLPNATQMVGFGLGLLAVWLISRPENGALRPRDVILPVLAGIGFGAFLVLISRATSVSTIYPLIGARIGSMLTLTTFALISHQPPLAPPKYWGIVGLAGILDSGGNAFFTLAASLGRLDVAGVLSSLYPASTVFLAWVLLREKLAPIQLIGVVVALAAIVLISTSP